jgi:hypothetical protein
MGNAPASGAVFSALAENIGAQNVHERPGILLRTIAGREARPSRDQKHLTAEAQR